MVQGEFRIMKVFITGIAGFLGSHLAEHFIKEGHEVTGIDNLVGGDAKNVPEGVDIWLREDCSDLRVMKKTLGVIKPDVVYHFACYPHEGLSVTSPHNIATSVLNASTATFSASIQNGVKRIVFGSSMSRYGDGDKSLLEGGAPFREFYDTSPQDPYASAKVASEQILKQLCETNDVEYVIAVPHNIVGIGQCYDDPFRNVAAIFLNRMKQGLPPIIYGDGEQTRCFSPIEDCVDCLATMGDLERKDLNGQTINIGPDGEDITVKELARLCAEVVGYEGLSKSSVAPDGFTIGSDGFLYGEDRPREVKHASCTADKARELLGYKPKGDLRGCLQSLADAIPDKGVPFRYDRYVLEIENDTTPRTWLERLM